MMAHKKGLFMINTGEGKGKTTAALGLMLRAWGHGMRVCMFQLLKDGRGDYGEYRAAEKIGMEIHPLGDGCQWDWKDEITAQAVNLAAWERIKTTIVSGDYDLIILDEFTFLIQFGWLDADEVSRWIVNNKPQDLHLLITGRDAPQPLIDVADLVTSMEAIKHPFHIQGTKAQKGIEY